MFRVAVLCLALNAPCAFYPRAATKLIPQVAELASVSPEPHVPTAAGLSPQGESPKEYFNACSLLRKSEVEAVQGAKVYDVRPADSTREGLANSQCHYAAASPDRPGENLSVILEVRRPVLRSSAQKAVREEWDKLRAGGNSGAAERLEHVADIGEDAYWIGGRESGVLHVLKKDKILVVGVGGGEDAGAKIRRSRALAHKALARL